MCVLCTCVELREQLIGVTSTLPLRGFWRSNSGHETWWQAVLSTEPSCWPSLLIFYLNNLSIVHSGGKVSDCHYINCLLCILPIWKIKEEQGQYLHLESASEQIESTEPTWTDGRVECPFNFCNENTKSLKIVVPQAEWWVPEANRDWLVTSTYMYTHVYTYFHKHMHALVCTNMYTNTSKDR